MTDTVKFKGRIHVRVETTDVQPKDVIRWVDVGTHFSVVLRVTETNVAVPRPKGAKSKVRYVAKADIRECWRHHSRVVA